MPKAEALNLVSKIKQGIILCSLAGFGGLSLLVLTNMHISATSTSSTQQPASSQATPSTSASSTPSSSGGILQPQGGGYGFGSGSSSQGPSSWSRGS
jgi:hypothetical protein